MVDQSSTAPVLEVTGARVAFAGRPALRGVSLRLAPGEVLALLGPNGAGKSTLIRIISGRLAPQRGAVTVDGLDPARDGRARRKVGIVPQGIALFEKLSARENLVAFGRLMGVAPGAVGRAADDALTRVGLSQRAGDLVGTLSGGMRRRINIAAALMHQPRVVILDEPTAGLDHQSQADLIRLIRDLRLTGLGVLLVTHDMAEAEAVADRIAVLVAGEIRAEGTVESLVAGVLGSGRELALRLSPVSAVRAGERIAAAFQAAGLAVDADGRTWTGLVAGRDESFDELVRAVLAADGVVEDLRIGRPGLAAVLRRLVEGQRLTEPPVADARGTN